MIPDAMLARLLRRPGEARLLNGPEWSDVIGQGRACALLARLGAAINEAGSAEGVPPAAWRHMRAAAVVTSRQYQQALYEIGNISLALRAAGCPAVLLKGAAYVAMGIPAGEGRQLSDIDVMVPREFIGIAESALMAEGWVSAEPDPYNQRYYREWMHEIPPIRHMRRGTVIDLHHSILPLTARSRLDASKLFSEATPIPGIPCLKVLSPVDMVLHSATHLFHEGEFDRGLRDLVDLDSLLTHFAAQDPGFWTDLPRRACELGLTRPLHYGLRYARMFLDTKVPDGLHRQLGERASGSPGQAIMDSLFVRAISPNHPSCADRWTEAARFLLYVRGHWLRMPLHLLAPHLLRKAWMRRRADSSRQGNQ